MTDEITAPAAEILAPGDTYALAFEGAMMGLVFEQAGGGDGYRDAETRGSGEISLWNAPVNPAENENRGPFPTN